MIHLPEHILIIINNYNSNITNIIIYNTCFYYKNLLENKVKEINILKDEIYFLYDTRIIDLMGGIGKMIDYPILDWNNDYVGSTGYLDSFNLKYITNKIMRGVDCWGRPFITLRIKLDKNIHNCRHLEYLCVLFQRYSDCKSSWTHSTQGYIDIISETGYFMNNKGIKCEKIKYNIYNLLNNKGFVYYNDYMYNRDYPKITTIEGIRLE